MEISELINNEEKKQFEVNADGHTAFVEYTIDNDNKIYLTHTEVPKDLEGKGVGSAMVKKVLQHIKEKGNKVVPMCPFISSYIDKHQEFQSLLSDGYRM